MKHILSLLLLHNMFMYLVMKFEHTHICDSLINIF